MDRNKEIFLGEHFAEIEENPLPEAEIIGLANLVVTNKVIDTIKQDIACDCHSCQKDAKEAIDWILYPAKVKGNYKEEIFRKLRKKEVNNGET